MIRISNVIIRDDISDDEIFNLVIKKHHIKLTDVIDWHISKKSIDARKKDDVHYNYSIDIKVKNEHKYSKFSHVKDPIFPNFIAKHSFKTPPLIVGSGPAGLFCALTLVEHGIKPIIIEQGKAVEDRIKDIEEFQKNRKLNVNSNVQFGEGGAGTFSDGKLTTGINSPFCKKVLQDFVKFGAPDEILYLSKPHIGTDNLIKIIGNIRKFIISKGGHFLFNTKVIDFEIQNNQIYGVITQNVVDGKVDKISANHVILAIGHSSRDTFKKIYEKGFLIEKKNFSVGVRIEHLQSDINLAQYGNTTKLKLPPADYKLAYHSPSGRSCYTFCMCPGGVVMASSSEFNTIVTNGMSNFARDNINANSALLVSVTPDDFEDSSPLAGMYFQKDLEERAFVLGGSNYNAPIQRVEDFIHNRKSSFFGKVKPSYLPDVTFSNLNEILPDYISDTLKDGILYFDTKLKGFADSDSLLTGLETRSSSPIRILRNEILQSNIRGVYPCGEGAGYAGGIMSASVDGIKCAISLITMQKNMIIFI